MFCKTKVSLKSKAIVVMAACFVLGQSSTCFAQKKMDSLLNWQYNQASLHWLVQTNANWQTDLNVPEYGMATATANLTSGRYRLPMEAEKTNQFKPGLEGMRRLNEWQINGALTYTKQYDEGIGWSNVYDAYGGSPLIWADSGKGNWERDHIVARLQLITPQIAEKWRAAMGLDYHVGTGARNTDPKPFYRYRLIALQPGMQYQKGRHTLGISGNFSFEQEENELGFYARDNVLLYRVRGYGLFSRTSFVNGERKRNGWQATGNLQWQYQTLKDKKWLLNIFAGSGEEEVTEGVANPVSTGFYQPIKAGADIVQQHGNMENGGRWQLRYLYHAGFIDDVILKAEAAANYKQQVQGEWAFWKQKNKLHTQWQFKPSFTSIEWVDQATQTQLYAATAALESGWIGQINSSNKNKWLLELGAGYHHNLESFINSRVDNVVISDLIMPAYDYFSFHRLSSNAQVIYQWNTARNKYQHRVQAQVNAMIPLGSQQDFQRMHASLTYSYLF
jgi:hypothetical protein